MLVVDLFIPIIVGSLVVLTVICCLTWIVTCFMLLRFCIKRSLEFVDKSINNGIILNLNQYNNPNSQNIPEEVLIRSMEEQSMENPDRRYQVSLPPLNQKEHQERRKFIKSEDECCICKDFRRVVTFIPCNHCCTCQHCAQALMVGDNYKCPLCREIIKDFKIDEEQIRKDNILMKGKTLSQEESLNIVRDSIDLELLTELLLLNLCTENAGMRALIETNSISLNNAILWLETNKSTEINDNIILREKDKIVQEYRKKNKEPISKSIEDIALKIEDEEIKRKEKKIIIDVSDSSDEIEIEMEDQFF